MKKKTIRELYYEVRGLYGPAEFDRRIRNWLMRQLRTISGQPEQKKPESALEQQCSAVIEDLNNQYGSRYRVVDSVMKNVKYWLDKGMKLEDFYLVHWHRIKKWKDDPVMQEFIRPSTLYRKSHFAEYLAQAETAKWEEDKKKKPEIKRVENDSIAIEASSERHARVMAVLGDLAKKKSVRSGQADFPKKMEEIND